MAYDFLSPLKSANRSTQNIPKIPSAPSSSSPSSAYPISGIMDRFKSQQSNPIYKMAQTIGNTLSSAGSTIPKLVNSVKYFNPNGLPNKGIESQKDGSWIGPGVPQTPQDTSSYNVNYQQTTPTNPYADLIQRWQDQSKNNQLAQINEAYKQAKNNIQARIPQLQQTTQQTLSNNEADVFTKYMPQMRASLEQAGVYRGGDQAYGTQNLLNGLQQANNQARLTESNQLADMQNRLNNLDSRQAAAIQEANGSVDAAALEKLLSSAQQANQEAFQQQQFNYQKQQDRTQNTGIYNPYADVQVDSNTASQLMSQYGNNIQAEINRRLAIDPADPVIPKLQALRYYKVDNDPNSPYKNQYMTQDARIQQIQIASQQLDNKLKELQIQNMPEQYRLQIEQLKNQVKAGMLSYDTALAQLENIKASMNRSW